MSLHTWLYRGGRPNRLAMLINNCWAWFHSLGLFPNYLVTLEIKGRRSGKVVSFPLAMAVVEGDRYLVSMLGRNANWVRNVLAAGGRATVKHGVREEVILREVDAMARAPILKAYLRVAPGARPHIPVDKDAPLSAFEAVAAEYPVFRLEDS